MTAPTITTEGQYTLTDPASRRPNARRFRRLATLRLVRECSFNAPDDYPGEDVPIRSPRDVFERMTPYAERETAEVFWVLALNAQHHLIGNAPEAVTRGILNSSLVHPREVFLCAIVARAAAVVLCHNHPSGDPTPSGDDRAVTEQLVAAGKLLDLPIVDHVIIGRGRYTSFAQAGLL
ncbi:MAG TPA: JAB domain-containing protein [Gemmatimonadaceae bacterium]|nr:JAB domain-containing protein [Gemmatimonadaceae bacterium]